MANIAISALPSGTAVTADDLLLYVDSPSGTSSTRQITVSNFTTSLQNLLVASGINGFNNAVSGTLPVQDIIAGTGILVSSSSGIFIITNALCASGSIANQNSNNVNITGGTIVGITDLAIADGGTGSSTASGARTNLGLGSIATQDASGVMISGGSISGIVLIVNSGTITNITDLAIADGGTGSSSASGARTNLGLGTMAVQNSGSVSITGGSISGITDLAIADGGTGASSASAARSNLGLGTMATQNASGVLITGGSIAGITWTGSIVTSGLTCTGGSITNITDLAIADGGTGASSASGARNNLGIGTLGTQDAFNVDITGGSITGVYINLPTGTIVGGSGITVARSGISFVISTASGDVSPALSGLTDVTITSVVSGNILVYNGNKWVNNTILAGSGISVSRSGVSFIIATSGTASVALSGLTDVTISSPVSGNILAYNGNKWVNSGVNVNISGSLSSLIVDNLKIDNSSISGISASYSVNGNSNGAIIIEPNSTGPLQGSYNGNARGAYATDWQRSRSANDQVAAGAYSVICGGQDNIIEYGAGFAGVYCVIGGGYNNTISDNNYPDHASIGGGGENTINNSYCTIPGGYRAKTNLYGELSHAAGYFTNRGDAQKSTLVLRGTTINATQTELSLDGSTSWADLPANSVWTYVANISALRNNAGTYDAGAGFIIRGCVRSDNSSIVYNVGSSIIDSFKDAAMSSTDALISSSYANRFSILVTGLSSFDVRWVATVELSQVSYGTP